MNRSDLIRQKVIELLKHINKVIVKKYNIMNWQSIDKPPDSDRNVILWWNFEATDFLKSYYENGSWIDSDTNEPFHQNTMINITHWTDINDPTL